MLWVCLGFALGIAVLLYFLIWLLGTDKKFISFVGSNEIEFRMTNETLNKIMENVPGYELKKDNIDFKALNSKGEIISSTAMEVEKFFLLKKGEKKRKPLWGIYWVGFPPYGKVLKWTFGWPKLIIKGQEEEEKKKGRSVEQSTISNQLISYASEKVTSLYHDYTYPIEITEIEMRKFITVSLFFNLKIETVVPIIPVIFLKGKWFEPLVSIISGIISECLRTETLEKFEKEDKVKLFSLVIEQNNERLISITGMRISDLGYAGYMVAGSDEVKKATTAGEVARLQGEGLLETAKAEALGIVEKAIANAKDIELKGVADAGALRKLMVEANKHPNGVKILAEQIRASGLSNFRGKVLSQGSNTPLQLTIGSDDSDDVKEEKKKKTSGTKTKSKPDKKESGDEKGED